ncbi:MAG: DeoR/GlpR transcriptional regulator [Anaerolineaceae bacterium]|nr:DeoR/GlpR transcriptional regulator [Anaerolineaceae bacterium]
MQASRPGIILDQIEENGSVNVVDLATALNVSEMTIRRDLSTLEKEGLIRRIHGGAVSARGRNYEPPLLLRSNTNIEVKQLLGKYAAAMVAEGDSLSLDVGSTTYELAINLIKRQNLTVLTPSLHISGLLLQQPNIRLILTGGILRSTEGSLIGEFARHTIENIFVDRLFLAVGAMDSQAGFTEYNDDDTLIKQAMIKNAKEVIVVADSSKFQKIAFSLIGPLELAHYLITDQVPPDALLSSFKRVGVAVHVVGENGSVQIL